MILRSPITTINKSTSTSRNQNREYILARHTDCIIAKNSTQTTKYWMKPKHSAVMTGWRNFGYAGI